MTRRTRTNHSSLHGWGSEAIPTSSAESRVMAGGKRIRQSRGLQWARKHTAPSAKVQNKNIYQQWLEAVSIPAESHVEKPPEETDTVSQ